MSDYAIAVYIMPDIWTLIASGVCGGICGRVASYQRCGARYRFGISMCAWLLAIGSGGYSLSVLLGILSGVPVYATSPFILLLLVSLLVLVWRARGNVGAVLRAE